jgi:hypothetical protein
MLVSVFEGSWPSTFTLSSSILAMAVGESREEGAGARSGGGLRRRLEVGSAPGKASTFARKLEAEGWLVSTA